MPTSCRRNDTASGAHKHTPRNTPAQPPASVSPPLIGAKPEGLEAHAVDSRALLVRRRRSGVGSSVRTVLFLFSSSARAYSYSLLLLVLAPAVKQTVTRPASSISPVGGRTDALAEYCARPIVLPAKPPARSGVAPRLHRGARRVGEGPTNQRHAAAGVGSDSIRLSSLLNVHSFLDEENR